MPRLLILLLAATAAADPTPAVEVFKVAEAGTYQSIRIPALLCTQRGTLIAVAEGRAGHKDQSGNDLLVSTSTDNGRTWSKAAVARAQGKDSLNNPCLVQDARSGTVFLHYQVFPAGTREGGKGLGTGPKGRHRNCLVTSTDEGRTWSKPVDITEQIKPPEAMTTASGPGIGIQLRTGRHAGRLVIPFNSQDAQKTFVNWVAFSDDGGKTWKRGKEVPEGDLRLNEVQVAETSDGGLYLNSRQMKGTGGRKVAWSRDGGATWTQAIEDKNLPEPVCQGSVLALEPGKPRLLFLNPRGDPPGSRARKDGVIRLSLDDGKTWAKSRLLVPGTFAYSSMALMKDGRIGILFEKSETNASVHFMTVDLPWIEKGE